MAFGESTMSRIQVQLWYKWFKEGRKDVDDDARPGRPITSTTDENIEITKKMILDNRRITIREVADCQAIFTNVLGMQRAAAKIVQNFKQKQCLKDVAQELLTTFERS